MALTPNIDQVPTLIKGNLLLYDQSMELEKVAVDLVGAKVSD